MITPPEVTNTGPGFNRGSGGGAQGCGFEERGGAHARSGGVHFLWPLLCVCVRVCVRVCGSQSGGWSFKKKLRVRRGESRNELRGLKLGG